MPKLSPYSPVVKFEIRDQAEGRLRGYAAPAGGAPCLLQLSSDSRPILYVRATRFSSAALTAGFRSGWCGFELPGLAQAFAIGDLVQVTCGVGGEVLATLSSRPDLLSGAPPVQTTLTSSDVLSLARADDMAPDLAAVLPFALTHLDKHGPRAFLEATYLTFLKRWPDESAGFELPSDKPAEAVVEDYLRSVIKSDEYAGIWADQLPGPFHPTFRYDRDLIV